jgi:hypothetical protein
MNRRIMVEVLPDHTYLISSNCPDGKATAVMDAVGVESGWGRVERVIQNLLHPDDEDPFQYGMRTLRWQPDRKSALQRDPKPAGEDDDIPF